MTQEFDNVWLAAEESEVLAESLRLRSQVMMAVSEYVKESGMSQAQAATALGTTQPRLNDVLIGAIEHCTLDKLLNMLAAAGFKVSMQIQRES